MSTPTKETPLPQGCVLIAGGGPVGLILARVLSHYGIKSLLLERNKTTTSWPKMDLTNARSMELFRKLGLADDLRKEGVPSHIDQDVLISTGLSTKEPLAKWDLPGVDKFRAKIRENNDGTQPLEPYQRLSQAIFEKWLKAICDEDPMIDVRFGWKVESVSENLEQARTTVTEIDTGASTTFVSDYVVGCDGASSRVRKSFDIPIEGGPIPAIALLVHFRSRDLQRLYKQGRFWHIFFTEPSGALGGAIISQDEIDTFTTHLFLPPDAETDGIGTHEAIYRVLGGMYSEFPITIDEVLVRSVWRPSIAVTSTWHSPNYRVFLAGDAAHVNIPTGGYGMNMGIADAFDLGWKLSSVIKNEGGFGLFKSYQDERKPVALRNVQHSGVHFNVHMQLKELFGDEDPKRVDEDTDEARLLRAKIQEYYQLHDGENKDFGVELGYRYHSPIVIPDDTSAEPVWQPSQYTPTTWPGGRPPHVFLSDGTAIFDKMGKGWTLLTFSDEDCGESLLLEGAQSLNIPLLQVNLAKEKLAKTLYERNLLLIRPDQHVAWRADEVLTPTDAHRILNIVTGRTAIDTMENGNSESH